MSILLKNVIYNVQQIMGKSHKEKKLSSKYHTLHKTDKQEQETLYIWSYLLFPTLISIGNLKCLFWGFCTLNFARLFFCVYLGHNATYLNQNIFCCNLIKFKIYFDWTIIDSHQSRWITWHSLLTSVRNLKGAYLKTQNHLTFQPSRKFQTVVGKHNNYFKSLRTGTRKQPIQPVNE